MEQSHLARADGQPAEPPALTPGLWTYQTEYFTRYGLTMAGLLIGSIPLVILFFFTSRWFVAGLTSGAIKV